VVVVPALSVVRLQLLALPVPVVPVFRPLGRAVRLSSTRPAVAVEPQQAEPPALVVPLVLVVPVVAPPQTVGTQPLTVPAVVVAVVSSPAPAATVPQECSFFDGVSHRSPTPVRIL
jgi:hypothetical protein